MIVFVQSFGGYKVLIFFVYSLVVDLSELGTLTVLSLQVHLLLQLHLRLLAPSALLAFVVALPIASLPCRICLVRVAPLHFHQSFALGPRTHHSLRIARIRVALAYVAVPLRYSLVLLTLPFLGKHLLLPCSLEWALTCLKAMLLVRHFVRGICAQRVGSVV